MCYDPSMSTFMKGTDMLLKEQFEATISRIGIDDDNDYDLASIIWKRCEDAMIGKTSQEAALLHKVSQYQPKGEQLTLQEIQFLNQIFAGMLTISSYNIRELKAVVQECWLLCDPDDDKTQENFEYLNQLRSLQRKFKKSHNQLAAIQRKLKKNR